MKTTQTKKTLKEILKDNKKRFENLLIVNEVFRKEKDRISANKLQVKKCIDLINDINESENQRIIHFQITHNTINI